MSADVRIEDREAIMSDAVRAVVNFTVPIYVSVSDGELQLDRTAILLRVGEVHFLLTAMHGLPELSRPEIRIFAQPGDGKPRPVELTGSNLSLLSPPFDVAVAKIGPTDVSRLGRTALTLRDLNLVDDWDSTTQFLICGYPIAIGTRKVSVVGPVHTPRPFTRSVSLYEGVFETPDKISKDVHLAVTWEKRFDCVEYDGKLIEKDAGLTKTPKAPGISGGGIWRLGLHPEHETKTEAARFRCKLSAIQHSVHAGMDYAIGTRVGIALYLIWKEYPALRPEIERVFPNTFPIIPPLSRSAIR